MQRLRGAASLPGACREAQAPPCPAPNARALHGPGSDAWCVRPGPAGVLNGGRTVTDDTCLYAESLALNTVLEETSGELQAQLLLGLRCATSNLCVTCYSMSDRCGVLRGATTSVIWHREFV